MTTRDLQQLKDSAMKSATELHHQMTAFQGLHEQPLIAESICEKCEAYGFASITASAPKSKLTDYEDA